MARILSSDELAGYPFRNYLSDSVKNMKNDQFCHGDFAGYPDSILLNLLDVWREVEDFRRIYFKLPLMAIPYKVPTFLSIHS